MERVRKTFFDPLATSKAQIRHILEGLPVGSAHPFSPERVLLCRTENGIDEIDVSSYPEDFFFNAVDLGEMGETLLRRMAGFHNRLSVFDDFQIQQAPTSTFKIPIVSGEITILAVSEKTPTYYDFCFADASCNTCCFNARNTFPGISHSGDIVDGKNLLHYVKINKDSLTAKEICVFISGYESTQITRFLGTNPALLVANHVDKILYIIPVPLDVATIGDASICCPLVIKRDEDSLICSILPTATIDRRKMCNGGSLQSTAFPEAIARADFTVSTPQTTTKQDTAPKILPIKDTHSNSENLCKITANQNAVVTTNSVTLPSLLNLEDTQIITFGTGLEFKLPNEKSSKFGLRDHMSLKNIIHGKTKPSAVVLPCVFGTQLEGPLLLATGRTPSNVPFSDEIALRNYYKSLKDIVFIVDERMTDNARNLATSYRINALFIVQLNPNKEPKDTNDVLSLLDSANINAVTALAGPQSLVLVQIRDKYYFYRGLANRARLNTSRLAFGSDVTAILESGGLNGMIDPRAKRMINLDDANSIILAASGQQVQVHDLQKLFDELTVENVQDMEEDINTAVPQLQLLLNQKDLQELSKALLSTLSAKVGAATAPLRDAYVTYLAKEYRAEDPESTKKKNLLLGELRKRTKELQKALEPAISSLANMMSSQTTSKRTHDLKRLIRQAQINGNVEATKSMTFETLAGYLETYAEEMGVILLNIDTMQYNRLLGNLKNAAIDASACCDLDSRILYLEGFDAGIIMEQSQNNHEGPLRSQSGPSQPILAVPYLNQGMGVGSMLAWVCWDEFVNLKSPYTVRWMDKCNEPHIAALRIIMRSTLSEAVASREYNIQPSSPETGHLMSALLMAAMSKLAAMRTTAPVVLDKAEDTVTRLMRGLFGNLLTTAGSGVRPLSMVWQLFGLNPQYDVPTNEIDWVWYETVVALYPYTGWPLQQFHTNLEKLLDKVIVRVVTKNENIDEMKKNRAAELAKYCKLRNIQLDHSRTIITIFMRMLTAENVDIAAIAARLLEQLPETLEKQTRSYTRMINYLKHLAQGGERRVNDDLIAANVYTKRSAVFSELKSRVSEACLSSDWAKMKESCQALLDKHAEIASLWHVSPENLRMQNMKPYKDLLAADFSDGADQEKTTNHEVTRKALYDAEKRRVPWQVGKEGEFGDKIEPLDEVFVQQILAGETTQAVTTAASNEELIPVATPATTTVTTTALDQGIDDEFSQFKSSIQRRFIDTMQKDLSSEDVCRILNVPVTAMRVFVKALNPDFVWGDLSKNFKPVILGLLTNRSNRDQSRPAQKLFELDSRDDAMQIEG